jgi:hypothetical protein
MKNLVESSCRIDTHILKEDLQKTRERLPVAGFLSLIDGATTLPIDYKVEYEESDAYLVIEFDGGSQRILLSNHELTFGTRTYLTCACGCRTNALYLNKGIFACRKCHKLCYQSTTINKTTKHGQFLFKQSQIIKLMEMREGLNRIFYKSQYSKPFVRWLALCERAGLVDDVEDAKELMLAINRG